MLEYALGSLLRLRCSREMEEAVLDVVRRVTSSDAVALYRKEGSGYQLRVSSGPDAARWKTIPVQWSGLGGPPAARYLTEGALPPGAPWLRGGVAARIRCGEGASALLLVGPGPDGEPCPPEAVAMLERVLDACGVALQNAALFDHLNSLVLVDALTGCYNRRGFDEHLKVEMVRARRYRRPISLLVLDVDHFKQVNDGYGHMVGDAVLRRVGEVLAAEFRTTDVVCRFGGDEFAVIFPETAREDVRRLAERLRARIAGHYPAEPFPQEITVSLGIAGFPEDASDPEALLGAADRALYLAKAGGRNRVTTA